MSGKYPGSWVSGAYAESRLNATFVLATVVMIAIAAQPANAQHQFAYVANFANQATISGLAINETNGSLTPVSGSPFSNGSSPISVAVDPTGAFLYASGGEAIEGYAINAATGALNKVPGSPFSDPTGPVGVTVDSTGKFVYAANFQSGNVGAFRINASTGALIKIPGSPFAADAGSYTLATDPTGRFLYVSNEVAGNITEYAINATTGVLTPLPGSPVASAQNTLSLAIDPLGRFLYETNQNGTVLAFQLDPNTGALSPVAGSPFTAGEGPNSVAVDPTGKFVYVVNGGPGTPGSATVSAYTINLNFPFAGGLTPVPGSPFAAGNQSGFVTVDPAGKFVYVANFADSNVGVYAIDFTGALSPVPGSPFASGPGPEWIAITPPNRRTHPVYSATQVPLPPAAVGGSLFPAAINNKGEVAGSVTFQAGSERFGSGFLYSGGTTITVGFTRFSSASGINDRTQVVGQTSLSSPGPLNPPEQAFLYSNGTTTNLDNVPGRQSDALSINNAGEVTGTLSTLTCVPPFCFPSPGNLGDTHAFIDTGHGLSDLGTLGGNFSAGESINNIEEIVGASNVTKNGPNHLFLYYHGRMFDLAAPAGLSTQGLAINDLGEIIGSSSAGGFLYISGALLHLPPMNGGTASLPHGINNLGAVVGASDVAGGGPTHAFLYNNGGLTDLNNAVDPSLPLLTSAAGINDRGQVLVTSLTGRVYILTPRP